MYCESSCASQELLRGGIWLEPPVVLDGGSLGHPSTDFHPLLRAARRAALYCDDDPP
jgi:hypothetical protein